MFHVCWCKTLTLNNGHFVVACCGMFLAGLTGITAVMMVTVTHELTDLTQASATTMTGTDGVSPVVLPHMIIIEAVLTLTEVDMGLPTGTGLLSICHVASFLLIVAIHSPRTATRIARQRPGVTAATLTKQAAAATAATAFRPTIVTGVLIAASTAPAIGPMNTRLAMATTHTTIAEMMEEAILAVSIRKTCKKRI